MTKFKVGDRVKVKEATRVDECNGIKTGKEYTVISISPHGNAIIREGCFILDSQLELVARAKPPTPVNFIFLYKLNEKEEGDRFETRKDVETRIKELAKRTDLERDSIKVYEIAKTYDVTLETRVLFGSNVTLTETPKRGRKSSITPEEKRIRQAQYNRRWYKKDKAKRLKALREQTQ